MYRNLGGKYGEALQSRTGPVQGQNRVFPVYFSNTGKNLFSLQGSKVMEICFPCEKKYTGKTLFSLQGWVGSEVRKSQKLFINSPKKRTKNHYPEHLLFRKYSE